MAPQLCTNVTKRKLKNQVTASLLPRPEKFITIHLTLANLVDPAEKPSRNYQPREVSNRQISTDKSEATPKPASEEFHLSRVSYQYRERLCTILTNCETMWDGTLREVSTVKHGINLKPGSTPKLSRPYRFGSHTRNIVSDEVK